VLVSGESNGCQATFHRSTGNIKVIKFQVTTSLAFCFCPLDTICHYMPLCKLYFLLLSTGYYHSTLSLTQITIFSETRFLWVVVVVDFEKYDGFFLLAKT